MAHFGVLSYKGTGHLNPLMALSRQLIVRGHRVTLFQHPELEQQVRQQGLEFSPINVPHRTDIRQQGKAAKRKPRTRIGQIRSALQSITGAMEAFLREYPPAIQAAAVDVLIMGEISLTGPTVAEMLRLPYVIISTSIPHNFGWSAPRSIARAGSWLDRIQREILEVSILRMHGPVRRNLDRHRRRMGLGSIRSIGESHPELAHITQWPRCLDLHRAVLPSNFFYAGPFVDEATRGPVPFPWQDLDNRPMVYASLGTTRKADPAIYSRIAEACHGLGMQLVISLGGRRDPATFAGLPGNPLVVSNAPQLALLKRAELVVTHGGPNTVLETLLQGKPMVALPMVLDQPAVAARLLAFGVSEVLPMQNRSTDEIRAALIKVYSVPSYRNAARRLQSQLQSLRGLEHATDIIEAKLGICGQTVLNDISLNRPVTTASHERSPERSRRK